MWGFSSSPIIVNDNVIDFTITPGEEGKKAKVVWRPLLNEYTVASQVDTVEAGEPMQIDIRREATGYILRGQIPVDHEPLVLADEVGDAAQ